jgi:hypothetical protein
MRPTPRAEGEIAAEEVIQVLPDMTGRVVPDLVELEQEPQDLNRASLRIGSHVRLRRRPRAAVLGGCQS